MQSNKVLKLHLELGIDPEDDEFHVVKQFGKVKESISRDILVPAEMPLYAFHDNWVDVSMKSIKPLRSNGEFLSTLGFIDLNSSNSKHFFHS